MNATTSRRPKALLLDGDPTVLRLLGTASDLPGRDAASLVDLVRRAGGEADLGIVVLAGEPSGALRTRLFALGADAVVDRALGPDAAADVIAGLARRTDAAARTWLDGAVPAVRGALAAARAAFAAPTRLANASA